MPARDKFEAGHYYRYGMERYVMYVVMALPQEATGHNYTEILEWRLTGWGAGRSGDGYICIAPRERRQWNDITGKYRKEES